MTLEELKSYYSGLLIIQYNEQTKAKATIKLLVSQPIMNQLPTDVENGFDLDSAVGVQLNILGKYIGLSRNGYDFDGFVILTDDQYRQALKFKIALNNFGSSLYDIQLFISTFFPGQMYVFDYLGMRISYYIDTDIGDLQLAEFLIMQELLPRPMGVQLGATIYGPTLDTFFGFRTYEAEAVNNSPFNTYEDYETDRPFLTYEDALIP